ncbi:putative protein 29 [Haloarcula hispanica icosahedral virus 2]|uniref:Uncharacterized protein n=1 Tax=Haloarcula hispanica icosahedral virus 2 TaxID=1154689 RepID=H9AZY5_9VIRU|nr:putative protein 29 [Haloarcula hispanica icosahedral virus 2]AFD02310.1 putative protein 29 [Haloarcula hispanica icosahedral virus 2]
MNAPCERCETPTDAGSLVVGGRAVRVCDNCRHEFDALVSEWLDGADSDPLGADCSECGGSVDATVRYKGGGAVDLVLVCSGCGQSGRMEGGY